MEGSEVVVFNIESLDSDNMVLNIVQQDHHPSRDNRKHPDAPLATFSHSSNGPGVDTTDVHVAVTTDKGVGAAETGVDDSTNNLTFIQEEEKSAVLSIMDL